MSRQSDGLLVEVNDGFSRITGYQQRDVASTDHPWTWASGSI